MKRKTGLTCTMLLAAGMTCHGLQWKARDFKIFDPSSLWDVRTYTQADVGGLGGIAEDLVGKVWSMKYNPEYELDKTNSIELALDLWAKHGWFSLVWIDGETGEQHRIADSNGAEGEGHYRVTIKVDKNHPLAGKLLSGQGQLTTVQMLNREKPKPKYGTWYAGQYYVDILDWAIEGGVTGTPEPGFQTEPSISTDPATGEIIISFNLPGGGLAPFSATRTASDAPAADGAQGRYFIEGSTNLVDGEWFEVAEGTVAKLNPEERQMFLRLAYEEAPAG